MKKTSRALFASAILAASMLARPVSAVAQEGEYLWRVLTVRAAPGELLQLIDLYDEQRSVNARAGDGEMYWMRHSQGDHWDLMLMFPMGSFAEYYGEDRMRTRRSARSDKGRTGTELQRAIDAISSEREELFARGPAPDVFADRYSGAGLFHIEMFIALHDKRDELLAQRRMENEFYTLLDRAPNMIFVREAGAPWDMFTLGFYESLIAYAQAGDLPTEVEDRAARQAGFEATNRIGTYLRSLMLRHRDTLAGRVR